jgi:hypothetical protein
MSASPKIKIITASAKNKNYIVGPQVQKAKIRQLKVRSAGPKIQITSASAEIQIA